MIIIDKLEKLDLKQIKNYIFRLIVFVLLISLVPLVIYLMKFNDYEISSTPSDWSEFSTFISGTTGVLLSFFAVIFALLSLLITTIVAKSIQTKDFAFNQKQKEFELRMTHLQNKPYPYLDLANFPTKTSITLQNMGLGTLIVSKIKVIYKENEEFNSFWHLFEAKLNIVNTDDIKIETNSAPNHVLGPNAEKSLLKIIPTSDINKNFKSNQLACKSLLRDCEVVIEYKDIFENKFDYTKELSFLR